MADAVRLAGWSRSCGGQPFNYHSSHPDARLALLCRAQGERLAIAWQTAPVPAVLADSGSESGQITFLWLAGLAVGKGAHRFTLSAGSGNERWRLAFRTDGGRSWRASAPPGASLSFTTAMIDQLGELFGVMALTLPAARLVPGAPIDLQLVPKQAKNQGFYS